MQWREGESAAGRDSVQACEGNLCFGALRCEHWVAREPRDLMGGLSSIADCVTRSSRSTKRSTPLHRTIAPKLKAAGTRAGTSGQNLRREPGRVSYHARWRSTHRTHPTEQRAIRATEAENDRARLMYSRAVLDAARDCVSIHAHVPTGQADAQREKNFEGKEFRRERLWKVHVMTVSRCHTT